MRSAASHDAQPDARPFKVRLRMDAAEHFENSRVVRRVNPMPLSSIQMRTRAPFRSCECALPASGARNEFNGILQEVGQALSQIGWVSFDTVDRALHDNSRNPPLWMDRLSLITSSINSVRFTGPVFTSALKRGCRSAHPGSTRPSSRPPWKCAAGNPRPPDSVFPWQSSNKACE
jgi:hypothetical protein